MMKLLAVAAAVLAVASFSSAATITWVGFGPDNLWSTALNWNTNSVPGATDDVIFHNGTCVSSSRVAINSLSMGDRLEAKASLTILNSFFVADKFLSYQNGEVSLTSGASALNGVFTIKGAYTMSSGSVSGTVTVSGPADLSGAAAKTVKTGSLTLSGTSKVGGVISLDGTNPSFVVSGSSSWSNIHMMPSQKATGAKFDCSKGSVAIDSDVSIQANGKFGTLSIVNKANMSLYSDVSFGNTLNIPNNSFVATIGSAKTSVLISGGGNFVAGGASTSFGAVDFAGTVSCTGVSCTFGGKKSSVGNLVAFNGAVSVSEGTALSASIFSIGKSSVTVKGAVAAQQFNIIDNGALVGSISSVNMYVKNNNAFNLNGAVSASKTATFAGASFNFLPSGAISLAKGANSSITGTLKLGGTPTAAGLTNNGNLAVANAVTSINVNFKGAGNMHLRSSITMQGGEFGAGKVTMTSGSFVTGRNSCLDVGAFSAGTVKAKVDAVSFSCPGGCTNVNAACGAPHTDTFSFSA